MYYNLQLDLGSLEALRDIDAAIQLSRFATDRAWTYRRLSEERKKA